MKLRTGSALSSLLLLAIFAACENDIHSIPGLQKNNLSVDEVTQAECFFSREGKVQAKLVAPYMLRYYDSIPRVEFPQSLHVDFFSDKQEITSYLNAKTGIYNEQLGKVLLKDSVVVIQTNGDTLKTQELIWEQAKHIFYTKEDVEIRQKTKTIFGKGFESDEQLKNFRIDSVKGVMMVQGNQFGD